MIYFIGYLIGYFICVSFLVVNDAFTNIIEPDKYVLYAFVSIVWPGVLIGWTAVWIGLTLKKWIE